MEDSSMKIILKHILNTSALLLTGIVFAGCSSSDAPIEQPINPTGKYTMTVNASKGSDATTRALYFDGTALNVKWTATEKVAVYNEGWSSPLGTLTAAASSDGNTTLSGDLTTAPAVDDKLYLLFPRAEWDYTNQKGVLLTADDDTYAIEKRYDYALADVKVKGVDDKKKITIYDDASFVSQQAIVKFTLQNAKGESLAVDKLTVSATGLKTSDTTTGDITITPASATNEIYAALSGISDTKVTLTAKKGSDTYALTTPSNVSFADGKYYTVTAKLRLIPPIYYEPLTFKYVDQDCNVSFTDYNGTLKYSYDKVNWDDYPTSGITLNSTNPIVYFRGDKATKYGSSSGTTKISCDAKCKVYGNIMSLIDPTNFATCTELPGTYVFHELFKKEVYNSNEYIINDNDNDLVLSATNLTSHCYSAMFNGCAGLTRAPVLPATTLVANCYEMMFADCIKLKYIKCLATDISATDCTNAWVGGTYGVSAEGSFVKASGMTSWPTGYDYGIPSGWTVTSE